MISEFKQAAELSAEKTEVKIAKGIFLEFPIDSESTESDSSFSSCNSKEGYNSNENESDDEDIKEGSLILPGRWSNSLKSDSVKRESKTKNNSENISTIEIKNNFENQLEYYEFYEAYDAFLKDKQIITEQMFKELIYLYIIINLDKGTKDLEDKYRDLIFVYLNDIKFQKTKVFIRQESGEKIQLSNVEAGFYIMKLIIDKKYDLFDKHYHEYCQKDMENNDNYKKDMESHDTNSDKVVKSSDALSKTKDVVYIKLPIIIEDKWY